MIVFTSELCDQFKRDGCLAIPGFLTSDEVKEMRNEAQRLLDEFDIEGHPMTTFATEESPKGHVGDQYFLESEDKVRYFLEEGAIGPDGRLTMSKEHAVNKIGHGLHDLIPVFAKASVNDRVRAIARALEYKDPMVLQSMLIFKQPKIGGAVPCHQDSSFLYTDPPSALGFWFALEDCKTTNGCLEFVSRSHLITPITSRFVVKEGRTGTEFVPISDVKPPEPDPSEFKAIEVPAGTLVLIHGSVLHRSAPNLSDSSRYIYTFHIIEGTYKYDERNWLQPRTKPFTRLYTE
ncbi:hypothetical protein EV182_003821 [Spiromyces aspiralis]|uniref:Uncharacterized protein n=1 Tax=Spiromyces aspiralis TaxID=68401 RepID=A0ACC1HJS6_9FUNG|nr:hypothetical protein EV182_003821 [Spiromyces aspiralis]